MDQNVIFQICFIYTTLGIQREKSPTSCLPPISVEMVHLGRTTTAAVTAGPKTFSNQSCPSPPGKQNQPVAHLPQSAGTLPPSLHVSIPSFSLCPLSPRGGGCFLQLLPLWYSTGPFCLFTSCQFSSIWLTIYKVTVPWLASN